MGGRLEGSALPTAADGFHPVLRHARRAADFIATDPRDLGCNSAVPRGREGKEETGKMGMKIGRSLSNVYQVARKAPALRLREVWLKALPAGKAKAEISYKKKCIMNGKNGEGEGGLAGMKGEKMQ